MRVPSLLFASLLLIAVPAAAQEEMPLDDVVSGALSDDDPVDDGTRYDVYTFPARAGARYMVTLTSGAFDALVRLGPADGDDCRPCVSDDNTGGDTDAMLLYEASADGMQVVRVTSAQPGAAGVYRLLVETENSGLAFEDIPVQRAEPADGAGTGPSSGAPDVLRMREDAMGELSAADPVLEDGSHYDVWRVATRAGMAYAVYLLSEEFDESLAVGTGTAPRCDGCVHATRPPDMPHTLVEVTAPGDGMMTVRVSSARPGQTGRYIVAVHDETSFTPDSVLRPRPRIPSIQAGREVNHELVLAEEQERNGDGQAGDLWRYSGRAGERVVVSLRSDDFDPILHVFMCGTNGEEELAYDDDGGGGTSSRIEITLPRECEYDIRVASLLWTEAGRYTLKVESRP